MCSLGAFVETMNIYNNENVTDKLWEKGLYFKDKFNQLSKGLGIGDKIYIEGAGVALNYRTKNMDGKDCLKLRTYFAQELISNYILMPWISISLAHTENTIAKTLEGIGNSMEKYKRALEEGVDNELKGDVIKPVFRKYN